MPSGAARSLHLRLTAYRIGSCPFLADNNTCIFFHLNYANIGRINRPTVLIAWWAPNWPGTLKREVIMKKALDFTYLLAIIFVISLLSNAALAGDVPRFSGWQSIGPAGGDARTVVIDPKNKDHIYATTLDGQIYTSLDAGITWRLLANLNQPQIVLDNFIIDQRDSRVMYVSGNRGPSPGGFFKSIDGGVTWKESSELKNEAIHALTQSSLDRNLMLAGTTKSIWISRDSGDSWKKLDGKTVPNEIDSLAIDPTDVNLIYAGTTWRPYKSTDGGKTWRMIKQGMLDDSDVFAIDIDEKNPNNLYMSACSGIYFSSNKGELWKKVQGIPSQSRRTRDILQNPGVSGVVYAATTEGFWMGDNGNWTLNTSRMLEVNSIAVHPSMPKRVFIGTNNHGIMVSDDGGKSFRITSPSYSARRTYYMTADVDTPSRLYAATINSAMGGGAFFVSTDGGQTWAASMRNITNTTLQPYHILQDRKNTSLIYMATNYGLYRSLDRGGSWAMVGSKSTTAPKAPAKKKGAKTAPKPATTAASVKVSALTGRINTLAFSEDGKNSMFAGTVTGLYRTTDVNLGWERVKLPLSVAQQIGAIYVSKNDPNSIWVGTEKDGVLHSRDSGATWDKISGVPETAPISSIIEDPVNPQKIFVGTTQTLYLSRDGGASWVRRGGNLPLGNYTGILINPRNPSEVFVASALESNGGIYQSTDGGNAWKRIDTTEPNVASRRFWTLMFDPADANRIFAGTHSAGIYRIERASTASTSDAAGRPRIATNQE